MYLFDSLFLVDFKASFWIPVMCFPANTLTYKQNIVLVFGPNLEGLSDTFQYLFSEELSSCAEKVIRMKTKNTPMINLLLDGLPATGSVR